jgi:hypothetical protein
VAPDVVGKTTADLLGAGTVEPLEIARVQVVYRGAIDQVLDLIGILIGTLIETLIETLGHRVLR